MAQRSDSTAVPGNRDGERRLAAIVFTDIVGYSALVNRDDANAMRLVEAHFALVREIAPRFGGKVIKTIGDSVHLQLASAQAATACAIAIQQAHRQRNAGVAASQQFEIRIGLHLGDVEHRDGDIYGDGVNIAARLQPLAPVGGIAISDSVRNQLRLDLRNRFTSRGMPQLKNIDTPIELFVLEGDALAELEVEAAPSAMQPPPAAAPASVAPRRAWMKPAVAAGVALLVVAAGYGVAQRMQGDGAGTRDATANPSRPALAVLPFANTGGDPSNEYFSDGLSEELINTLSRVNTLKVMGRGSSFVFKDTKDDSRTIGQKLGVAYLVEGSVRKAMDRVRIGVSLVRADDGSNLWTESYDRELKDIFGVQTEIATAVTAELQRSLGLTPTPATASQPGVGWPPSGNVEAYQALLQGMFHTRRSTAVDEDKAIEYFQKAVALDPRYAMAYARLALSLFASTSLYGGKPPAEQLDRRQRGRAAAAKALELEPDLAMAHVVRGHELQTLDLRAEDAAREYRRAVELAPNDPTAVRWLGRIQAENGHVDEALEAATRAVALDPLWSDAQTLRGIVLDMAGRYVEAEAAWRKALELEPQAAQNFAYLALAKVHQGDAAAAVAIARQEPEEVWRQWALAIALFANGDRKAADEMLEALIRDQADYAAFQIAEIYAERRDPDQAMHWLEQALKVQDPGVSQLYLSSSLMIYSQDPRYAAVARKVGLDPASAPAPPKTAAPPKR